MGRARNTGAVTLCHLLHSRRAHAALTLATPVSADYHCPAVCTRKYRRPNNTVRKTLSHLSSFPDFQALVAAVKDYAIFMLDPRGRVSSWNAGARRIKGYRSDEIVGEHFSRFYTQEDIELGKPDSELKVAASVERLDDEGWRVRKDGSRFWANVVITAIRGRKWGVVRILQSYCATPPSTRRPRRPCERAEKGQPVPVIV